MDHNQKDTALYVAYDDFDIYDESRPEKNLLLAILMNALNDLNKPGESRIHALDYFMNSDENYIFSFHSVCNHLEIEPKLFLQVVGLEKLCQSREKISA